MADEKAELCGRLLADLGADVVRVERVDVAGSRSLPPMCDGTSLFFALRNVNKRGATVDLRDDAGRQRLLDLLAGADIWIETTRPGELAAVGLDPRALCDRFPTLVVLSVTDFGQTGPYRDFVATNDIMEAMAWMLFRAGVPELPPLLAPGSLAYDMVGASAAFATVTAYLDRLTTGRGQYLDMSVMEAALNLTDWALTSYSSLRRVGIYGEVRNGGGKAYPIIPCADGFVRPAMVTTAEWRKLRDWLPDEDGLLHDDVWDQQSVRIEVFDELLRPVFVEFFKDKTMLDLSIEGQRRGIPITPMFRPGEALRAEQFDALGSFIDFDPGVGRVGKVASGYAVIDGARVGPRTPAPSAAAGAPVEWAPRPSAAEVTKGAAGRPYLGLRVLEFGVAGAGPEISRLLSEYGADVVKVECPARPDLFRLLGGPSGIGATFASSNRSKRSIAIDFTREDGASRVLDLVRTADVVIENLALGTLERFGLGPDAFCAVNTDVLVVSSQSMGRRGPWARWRGYGGNTQLPSGMSYLWSFPDAPEPVPQNVAFPDHFIGRLGALLVASDLVGRYHGSGGARHIEIAQVEMALNLLADLLFEESVEPGSVGPQGNRSTRGAPWGVYPCAGEQRWCVITCRNDAEWRGVVTAMGSPAWARVERFGTADGRRRAHDEIDEHLRAWTCERNDRDVMALLQQAGVPSGIMMTPSLQVEDPHLETRGYLLEVDQPGLGPVLFEGAAFHATGLGPPTTRPAPYLGQHTRAVAAEMLGLSATEIDRLVHDGVLADREDGDVR